MAVAVIPCLVRLPLVISIVPKPIINNDINGSNGQNGSHRVISCDHNGPDTTLETDSNHKWPVAEASNPNKTISPPNNFVKREACCFDISASTAC